jgi:hypothetical protein
MCFHLSDLFFKRKFAALQAPCPRQTKSGLSQQVQGLVLEK